MLDTRRTYRRAGATMLALLIALACGGTARAADLAFYLPPSPLGAGVPGDVIRSQSVAIPWYPGARAWRVLYRSTTATGAPTAVSGAIVIPPRRRTDAPVIGIAPGFSGMADRCAASRTLRAGTSSEMPAYLPLLQRGYALAITDYEGLGTPGEHRYVVGRSAAHSLLDVIRAAGRLPQANVSPRARSAVLGYSQGGGAAMSAAELQDDYAPELPLVAVTAGGIPADFEAIAKSMDGGWFAPLLMAAALGYDAAYPELQLDSFLNSAGRQMRDLVRRACAEGIGFNRFIFTPLTRVTTRSPLDDPAWQARFRENLAGLTRPTMPLLLYHAVNDQGLPFAQAEAGRARYCANGAAVRWRTYLGADHALGFLRAIPDTVRWIDARLRGEPDPGNC